MIYTCCQIQKTKILNVGVIILGPAGVGKTCSASRIAKFLGLPYFEITIKTEAELSRSNMEGCPRHWQNSQLGVLSNALLATDSKTNHIKILF